MNMTYCASCGAQTSGTYRCPECERRNMASSGPTIGEPVHLDQPARVYRPYDAISALITMAITGRRGSRSRKIGLTVLIPALAVFAYFLGAALVADFRSW